MKNILVKLCIVAIMFISTPLSLSADERSTNSYNYDSWGNELSAAPTFEVAHTISSETASIKIGEVSDVATDGSLIYVVDQSLNKIDVFDENYQVVNEVTKFDGQTFNAPNAIALNDDYILVSDSGNSRIVVFNSKFEFQHIIEKPDAPGIGNDAFKPLDLEINASDDVYVIVQGVYEGILQLDIDGNFIKYVGTNKVEVNPIDLMYRSFATDEQLAQMSDFLPTEFSSMALDEDGFLYTTTTSDENEPIKKLNSNGENVLVYPKGKEPKGDLILNKSAGVTQLSSIAVNDNGLYSVIDTTTGRIFTYDEEGYLLSIYGNIGSSANTFQTPTNLTWYGEDKLIVTDKTDKKVVVLEETDFLKTVSEATVAYYDNDMESSREAWVKALNYDSNYELAYLGLGRVDMRLGDYDSAMNYFKLANNKDYYSKAFENVRKQFFETHFVIIMTIFIVVMVLLYRALGDGKHE